MSFDIGPDGSPAPPEAPEEKTAGIFLAVFFLLLLCLSGEREDELRMRLEYERAFSASVADEAQWTIEKLEE